MLSEVVSFIRQLPKYCFCVDAGGLFIFIQINIYLLGIFVYQYMYYIKKISLLYQENSKYIKRHFFVNYTKVS